MGVLEVNAVIEKISRGTTEIISLDDLRKKLLASHQSRIPLRIKAGFDPTAADIHLGHVVLLRKLRQFQDLGHHLLFLIGDFTARIGDPTGRDQTRPKLGKDEIEENAKSYKGQVFKILDPHKTEIVFNSSWLDSLKAQEILSLMVHSSVAQMLARADFKKRFEEQKEISLLEFVYPLLQGYDSVHLKSDIELGGSDQKFNLLMGRQMQSSYGQEPQAIIMTPLLEGTDGIQKMSKSLGNYVGVNETPDEIFGKLMSISDELMYRYFEVLTEFDLHDIRRLHPKEAKMKLACEMVAQFHGNEKAQKARDHFEKVFGQKQAPDEILEYKLKKIPPSLADILIGEGLVDSKREFHRLLQQGAISYNGQVIDDARWIPCKGIVKVGKRRFLKFI